GTLRGSPGPCWPPGGTARRPPGRFPASSGCSVGRSSESPADLAASGLSFFRRLLLLPLQPLLRPAPPDVTEGPRFQEAPHRGAQLLDPASFATPLQAAVTHEAPHQIGMRACPISVSARVHFLAGGPEPRPAQELICRPATDSRNAECGMGNAECGG